MIDLIKEILFGINDPNINQAILPIIMAVGGLAQAAAGFDWGGKRRKALDDARTAFEQEKTIYRGLEITNPYKGIGKMLGGLENVMEDLTVNKQQAQFEKQMFQQQQANIMQQFRGAAGGSGIAGLAQAMANQSMTQAQKASATIGQQEAKNRLLAAQQAGRLQQLEAKGTVMEAKGEQERQSAEMSRRATLMGMQAQAVTGAQQAQMQGQQMMAQGLGTAIGGLSGGYGEEGFEFANLLKSQT